ncbi:MAG: nucleoside deaminase [Chitinophagaceae bacterium]
MSETIFNSEYYMKLALQQAAIASEQGEVPVGAIVVIKNTIVAKAHNQTELLHDATAHAEILALTAAFQYTGSKYLPEATLYVTLEPCLMCAGALYWSKIGHIVYGANDEKNGYSTRCSHTPFHPKTHIEKGILKEDCAQKMKDFFAKKR